MWVFGELMVAFMTVLIGVLVWAVLAVTRPRPGPMEAPRF